MEEHFSVAEAAVELQMSEAALLRACLDEQLELSIRFSGRNLPYAKLRRQLPMEAGFSPRRVKTATLGLYDMTVTLGSDRSLWTLVMVGSGRLCVEDEYQKANGRTPAASDSSPSSGLGVFVSTPDASVPEPGYVMLYEFVEYKGTAPAGAIRFDEDFHSMRTFPAGSELVVSRRAISAFEAKRSSDQDVAPVNSLADGLPTENPEQRQRRRLSRFRKLGGDIRKAGGGQWQLTGTRGALAELAREEKNEGRARHDASDVKRELVKAAEAEYREQIGS